jgi:UDP-2,3-diacylglucosamine hydrolase
LAHNRLYVSDLHLSEPDGRHFRAFQRLMAEAAARFDQIYLLGDLCEVWVGDDDDGPLARAFVSTLARSAARASVFVMAGNRDFLFGERFEREAGVSLVADPHLLDDGVLLAHGDTFCVDDLEYQQARRVLRSSEWRQQILARPLSERRVLAEGMRAQSRATNANKAENIMDVSLAEVARVMRDHDAHTLIHGHTHRPGVHPASWGRRYVLGAWERCGWRLEEVDGRFELICFSLRD